MIDAILFALQIIGAITVMGLIGLVSLLIAGNGIFEYIDEPPSLDDLAEQIRRWGAVTFPSSTPESTAEHLRREVVDEIMADPTNGEEQADAFFLIVQLARVSGNDLVAEVAKKWEINQKRAWKKPDAMGVVLHVKEEAVPA